MIRHQKKLFWLYACALGCNNIISTFIPIFLQEKGFGRFSIGLILSASFMVSLLAMPFWGRRADRARHRNSILIFTQSMAALFLMLFIYGTQKLTSIVCYIAFSCFHCAGVFLADTIILCFTDRENKNYGHIRLGGTLGYAAIGAVSAVLSLYNFQLAILLYVAVVGLQITILVSLKVMNKDKTERNFDTKRSDIKELLHHKRIGVLLLFSFLLFVMLDFYSAFYGLYLRDMNASRFLVGVAFSVAALSEIPFLLLAKKLEKRFSLPTILAFAIFMVFLRFLGYAFTHRLWMAIALQLLQGVGNSVIIYVMVRWMYLEVPSSQKATGQALAALTGPMGLPGVFAALLGGYFSRQFSLHICFLAGSVFLLIIWIGYLIIGLPFLKGGFYERDHNRAK